MAAEQPRCTLVTGPASSGKSRWAETLARGSALAVVYLATGPLLPDDADWQLRLARHRQRRPSSWQLDEVGLALPEAIEAAVNGQLLLVDALGTWVAAGLDENNQQWQRRQEHLLRAISLSRAPLILVGEETTWGVSPATAIGGLFRERLGLLLQEVMAISDAAWLVVHGRAVDLLNLSRGVPPLCTD